MTKPMARAGGRFRAGIVLAAIVLVGIAGACTDNGHIEMAQSDDPRTEVSTASSDTSPGDATTTTVVATTVADTTVPASTVPGGTTTTVAPDPAAPPVTPPPLDPTAPTPVLEGEAPVVALPPPEIVRPPAAWVGFGLPQPGSMFENLAADRSLDGLGKFVALTFDDGPSQYTQQVYDILKFMGVKATFFQITDQTGQRLDLVRRMVADGMHIGAHTRGHPHLREIPPEAQADQVQGAIDVLNLGLGAGTVKCFRPPYAQYDQHVLDLVAERQVATAMWSFDTWDWKKPAWPTIVKRVLDGVRDRQVILMHDGGGDRTQTIAALPWIIQGLRDKGFQFIPVC